MAVYARSEDLVRIGAYKPGSDPDLDRALRAREAMRAFLTQEAHEQVRFADCAAPPGGPGRGGVSHGRLARPAPPAAHPRSRRRTVPAGAGVRAGRAAAPGDRRWRLPPSGIAAAGGWSGASAHSGELPDRLAGLEETRAASAACRGAGVRGSRMRSWTWPRCGRSFWARRVERRQAETLIRETEARDAIEAGRRGQQALDDWYGNKMHREEAEAEPARTAVPEAVIAGNRSQGEWKLSKNLRCSVQDS